MFQPNRTRPNPLARGESREQVKLERLANVERLKRIQAFKASAAWQKDILPWIQAKLGAMGKDLRWSPRAGATLDSVALGVAYTSGAGDELENLLATIDKYEREGLSSKAVLDREEAERLEAEGKAQKTGGVQ